jgi:Fe-Mn family superoxide dismutase
VRAGFRYCKILATRADYVKAWWNVANWADAAARFDRARTRTAGLIDQP